MNEKLEKTNWQALGGGGRGWRRRKGDREVRQTRGGEREREREREEPVFSCYSCVVCTSGIHITP